MSKEASPEFRVPRYDELVTVQSLTTGKWYVGPVQAYVHQDVDGRRYPVVRVGVNPKDKGVFAVGSVFTLRRPSQDEEAAWRLGAESVAESK